MTRLADPSYVSGGSSKGRVAQFSRDGKKFAVILMKSNLGLNTTDYSLLLWHTSQALDSPRPEVLLTLGSSSNRPAISQVKWLDDNETISFLGEGPNRLPQVYIFNIRTRRLRQLTSHATPIVSYDISADKNAVVFEADAPRRKTADQTNSRGTIITKQSLEEILAGDCQTPRRIC
jgi:Tol biopolymer transport system component